MQELATRLAAEPPLARRVLLIGFQYPPIAGTSGVQRILKFSRYLPEFGWRPAVLTVAPSAYESINPKHYAEIPSGVVVKRAPCLDVARSLSIRGRYPQLLALPDRWSSWVATGVPIGLSMVRRERIEAIWSTFPIASAQLLGYALARLTGLPWIADFRDPMLEDEYPTQPSRRKSLGRLERKIMRHAAAAVFTTPGMLEYYRARYTDEQPRRMEVIENGYDEESFEAAEARAPVHAPRARSDRIVLVHSGTLYPEVRDPRTLLVALAELKRTGKVSADNLRIVLRATGYDDFVRSQISEFGVSDLVEVAPSVDYTAALTEMLQADGLLILQAANSNYQIPAKLYEYLRAGRPILALTDANGDSGTTLRAVGIDAIAPLDDQEAVTRRLWDFVQRVRAGNAPGCSRKSALAYSRRAQSERLARLLGEVVQPAAASAQSLGATQ